MLAAFLQGSSWPSASGPSGSRRGSWQSSRHSRWVLGQLQEEVFERLLGETQLADVDPSSHQPPVDRRCLRWVNGQHEGVTVDPHLLWFEQGLEQSASLVERGGPDEKSAPAAAGPQLTDRSFGDELALGDHAHPVTRQFHLVQKMAGEQDRTAALLQLLDQR